MTTYESMGAKRETKYVIENAPVCLQCAKACDGRKCLWVRYLKREYLPEGAKAYVNPNTGNIHIVECPDMIPDRKEVVKCRMPDPEKHVNYFRKKISETQNKELMYEQWRMYLQHMA